jgi:YD repeat-containing protein
VLDALTGVTQGSQTRTYGYDKLGRLTSVATPEAAGVSTGYQYNDFNLITQRTDARGVITTYGYDTLNRLHTVSYNVGTTGVPATASLTYTYGTSSAQNNNGRLISMTDGVGSENYSYDILGRMTQLQKVISGTTYTTGYGYNLASELTSITYPSGRVVQQSYDAIGRLCAIAATTSACTSYTTPYATGFGYNTAFETTGFNYGNGVTASFGYSADRLQLTSLSYVKGTTTLFSLSYGYAQPGGNNGQIASISDSVDNGRSAAYTYDPLSRLSTAVTTGSTGYPKWGLSFTYDRYGNRTAQTVTAGTAPSSSLSIAARRIASPATATMPMAI